MTSRSRTSAMTTQYWHDMLESRRLNGLNILTLFYVLSDKCMNCEYNVDVKNVEASTYYIPYVIHIISQFL